MKIENNIYKSIKELRSNLRLDNFDEKRTLIQVFSSFAQKDEIREIQEIFRSNNPNLNFIGTTTTGEIINGEYYDNSIVISIVEFACSEVKIASFVHEDDFALGKNIASSFDKDTKVAIMFADVMNTNCKDVLKGITSINSKVPITGGLAGDYKGFKETYVFDKTNIFSKACVLAAIKSKNLRVHTDYQLNWQAIGQVLHVTKVEKKRLYKIDNLSVKEIYEKYFGKLIADDLPRSAVEFPLFEVRDDKQEIFHFFTDLFEEDGSVMTISNLEKGAKVRLSFGNPSFLFNKTISNIKKLRYVEPEVVFIYNCSSRKKFLQENIALELKPFKKIAPSCGFFSGGEFFHSKNKNFILNMTMTSLSLSEKELKNTKCEILKSPKEEIKLERQFIVLDALINLTNTVIDELENTQKKLKIRANRDYLTNLYNRRYLKEISKKLFMSNKSLNNNINIIVFDIDKFKCINDTYGHNVGDKAIKSLAKIIKQNIKKRDIALRLGGEEFALILPHISKEEAFNVAERLRKTIEKNSIIVDDNIALKFTISLGIDSVNLKNDNSIYSALDRADIALYEAKNTGRNKTIVYT